MQWKGRKIAFLTSCSFIIIGWFLAYIATSVTTIFISECFHGLGSNSILMVSTCSISEMCEARYRNGFVVLYIILFTIGLAVAEILGQYIHWKTVTLILSLPIVVAFVNVLFMWPESPSWLALKVKKVLNGSEVTAKKLKKNY